MRASQDKNWLPEDIDLLPEFKNAHKSIRLSSNENDFNVQHIMERMMRSRYKHAEYDPDLLVPNNRSAIIQMIGRQEQLDYFC